MQNKNNCFNLIRHIAALSVLFSHNFALNGLREPVIRGWDTIGFFSVLAFFSISGFLMPRSFNTSNNFMDFMSKRLRRISPALICCSFILIFIVSPIFSSEKILSYQFIKESLRLFLQHCVFIFNNPTGLFQDFKVPGAMNGSLWTIPIELACYIILATFMSFRNDSKSILLLFILFFIANLSSIYNDYNFVFHGIPVQWLSIFGLAFSTGSLLSVTQKSWFKYRSMMLLVSIALLLSSQTKLELYSLCVIAFSFIVIYSGVSFNEKLPLDTDISYGIYIYAFPVQQIVVNKVTDNFTLSLLISMLITTSLAFASFRYVERPFLKRYQIEGRGIQGNTNNTA